MINSASESKSMESQLSLEKKLITYLFSLNFYLLLKLDKKNAFLEGFTAFFKKCYEFLDFASFDNFKGVTSFASIFLVFHPNSSRKYLKIV